ncbi:MMPL family transporter [Methylococcus geothermalis]|uniref:MMPL family transporter n=1 Tax=Methylococcus geothermalis TaxID=2681310 RepID=A0A858QAX8_9GAMM|nr:MMPL family transporter [Methylococcus geothermalis]QJD30836.1 MMPL family transporter [Methylococcus geothermalis]
MTASRRWPLVVWLVSVCVFAVAAGRMRLATDLSAFLPSRPSASEQLLIDQLREGPASRLILIAVEGATEAVRLRLSGLMADRLRQDARFSAVSNGAAAEGEPERELLFRRRYLLSPAVTPERFSVEGLRAAVRASIDRVASSTGLMTKSLLPSDPTGELLEILDRMETEARPETAGGVWVSRDRKRALLLAQIRAAGSDTDAQQQALAAIRAAFAGAAAQAGGTDARLMLSGPAVFTVEARERIKGEAIRLSAIGTALVVVLLLAVYRSVTALALGLVPVATGAAAGIAAVSLGFGVVYGMTLGFGATLIGEAVDYAIYLFVQAGEGSGEDGRRGWFDLYWSTIRLGVLTSVCGALPLALSGFPGFSQLGVYSIAGLLAAAAVTRWVLPGLLPGHFRIHDLSRAGEVLVRLASRLRPLRWLVPMAVALACAIIGLHRDTLWNEQLGALSPVPVEAQRRDAELRADLGAPDAGYLVVVRGADAESALQAAERASARLAALAGEGVIAGFQSASTYLPSRLTQSRRRDALPEERALRERFAAAVRSLPVRPDRFESFFADVRAAREAPLLTPGDLRGTRFALAVDSLLVPGAAGWTALLPLRAPAEDSGHGLEASRIRAALSDVQEAIFLDLKAETDHLYRGYLAEATRLSAGGAGAIILLLALALRSPGRVLRVCLPLAAGLAVVTAALVASGHQLTMLHLIGMMLAVAIGSNYCLFFDRLNQAGTTAPAGLGRTLVSLTLANLATVAVFGLLAGSSVPVLSAIGVMVAPGTFLALVISAMYSKLDGKCAA